MFQVRQKALYPESLSAKKAARLHSVAKISYFGAPARHVRDLRAASTKEETWGNKHHRAISNFSRPPWGIIRPDG